MSRVARDDRANRFAHRAQVHRHVRRIGDQRTLGIEQGAAEIQSFLDVHGIGSVLQAQTHLLGDAHEEVVEQLQPDRIDLGARCMTCDAGPNTLQFEAARGASPSPAIRVRQPWWHCARPEWPDRRYWRRLAATRRDRGRPRASRRPPHRGSTCEPSRLRLPQCLPAPAPAAALSGGIGAGGDAFHRHRLDYQRLIRHEKRETLAIVVLELSAHRGGRLGGRTLHGQLHRQGCVRPLVAQVHACNAAQSIGAQPLSPQLLDGLCLQSRRKLPRLAKPGLVQLPLHRRRRASRSGRRAPCHMRKARPPMDE